MQLSLFEYYNCNNDGYIYTIDEQINKYFDRIRAEIAKDLGLPND